MADANEQQAQAATQAAPQTVDTATRQAEPLRNYKEVVELRKEVRSVEKLLKDLATRTQEQVKEMRMEEKQVKAEDKVETKQDTTAADVAAVKAELHQMKRTLALKDAFMTIGVTNPSHREALEKMVVVDKPEDIGKYVSEKVSAMFPKPVEAPKEPVAETKTPPVTVATAQPVGRSDTGAPGGAASTSLPDDPTLIPPDVWRSFGSKERRERYERWLAKSGMGNNPWAARRAELSR